VDLQKVSYRCSYWIKKRENRNIGPQKRRIKPPKRRAKPPERRDRPQKRLEGKGEGGGDGERVRKRRRREPRLPPPMKAGEGSLFRGERTERILKEFLIGGVPSYICSYVLSLILRLGRREERSNARIPLNTTIQVLFSMCSRVIIDNLTLIIMLSRTFFFLFFFFKICITTRERDGGRWDNYTKIKCKKIV
jgi:hypothetical protein